jgi:hypothetical protein
VLYAKGKSEGTPYQTVVVRSTDGGAKWTRPVGLGKFARSPALAAHGSDVVAQVGNTVKVSHDRGRTWSNASSRITLGVVRYAEGRWRSAFSYGDGIRYRTSVDGLHWSSGSFLPQYSEDLDALDVTSWDGRGAVLALAHDWSEDRHALVVAVRE